VDKTFGLDMSLAPGLSVQNGLLYLIMVGYLIETAVRRNRRFELPSVLLPFGLFIAYCILSWFVASFVVQPEYYQVFKSAISLKGERVDHLILFLLFFYGAKSEKETLSLIRIFLWLMVAANLLTIVDAFNIPDLGIIQQREDGRVGGPMGESNQYGAFLAFLMPAIIALLWDSGTKKTLAVFACCISFLALVMTGSRGAFAGLFVGSAVAVFFLRSFISLRQFALGLVISAIAVAALIAVVLSTDQFVDLVARFVEKSSGNVATMSSGRTAIWTAAMQRMLEDPHSFLTGFGWDAWDLMRVKIYNTHNSYLNILFNLGFPALVLYLVLVYNLIAASRHALRYASGIIRINLMAFVFGFLSLSACLVFVELYGPWNFIWAYAGLIMRLSVLAVQSNNMEHATS
jgi:hypothetical protein